MNKTIFGVVRNTRRSLFDYVTTHSRWNKWKEDFRDSDIEEDLIGYMLGFLQECCPSVVYYKCDIWCINIIAQELNQDNIAVLLSNQILDGYPFVVSCDNMSLSDIVEQLLVEEFGEDDR
jgi:hypothetical protein